MGLVPLLCILLDLRCWGKVLFSSAVLHPAVSTSKAGEEEAEESRRAEESQDKEQVWHCQQQHLTKMWGCGLSIPSQPAFLRCNPRVPFFLGAWGGLCHLQAGAVPSLCSSQLDLALRRKEGSHPHASQRSLGPFVWMPMLPGKQLAAGAGGDWAEDLKGDRKGKSKLNKTLRQQIH